MNNIFWKKHQNNTIARNNVLGIISKVHLPCLDRDHLKSSLAMFRQGSSQKFTCHV